METQLPVVRTAAGKPGQWNSELNAPKPNTTYVVDNKFVYHTDSSGRVVKSEAVLDSTSGGVRNTHQQRTAGNRGGRNDRQPGDQGGHIYGTQYGGPDEDINITGMKAELNAVGTREYGKLEDIWKKAADAGTPVNVKIEFSYKGNSTRPAGYDIAYTINGQEFFRYLAN
ncbi:DNA/RNA non-specific endonuclease [Nakamurella antarctica]|uniref:DNA/RNA non-specific endonuclease n=1 Tax=Nakamurella antarctica TaxID=1902245 RepID=UPI0013DE1FE8|nr:DNA/RNA non-specific endonuclease [Nakamurella antarctica]